MKPALSLFILLGFALGMPAFGETAESTLPSYLLKKGAEWALNSTSLAPPTQKRPAPVQYSRAELYEKILLAVGPALESNALDENRAYSVLSTLLGEKDLAAAHAGEFTVYVTNGKFSDAKKIYLNGLISSLSASSNPADPSPKAANVIALDTGTGDARVLIQQVREALLKVPAFFSFRDVSIGALDTASDMLLGDLPPGCYDNNPSCQYESNQGLIRFFSKQVDQDHALALATLRLSLKVAKYNQSMEFSTAPTFEDQSSIDLWPDALEAAEGNGPRALEALSVFGHDVCCNGLVASSKTPFLTSILNTLSPSSYGGDENPASVFFLPGAIAGFHVPKARIKALHNAIQEYQKLLGVNLAFRAGYHHFYGGIAIAQEMMAREVASTGTTSISTLFSEAMGYFYKRNQISRYLSQDAATLWRSIDEDEYKTPQKPEIWEQKRFDLARAELNYQIETVRFTEAQHRSGAKFALKVYRGFK